MLVFLPFTLISHLPLVVDYSILGLGLHHLEVLILKNVGCCSTGSLYGLLLSFVGGGGGGLKKLQPPSPSPNAIYSPSARVQCYRFLVFRVLLCGDL